MFALYLILFIGFVFLILKLALRYASGLTTRMVERRFRAAEIIVKERRVPEWWVVKLRGRGGSAAAPSAPDEKRTRQKLMKLLDELTKYFETCPLFDSEETRALMVSQLDEVYDDWKERPLAELLISDRATQGGADG